MKDAIDKILDTRAEQIEMFAAAFLREVGSHRASLYQLIEERSKDGLKTMWYFMPRAPSGDYFID